MIDTKALRSRILDLAIQGKLTQQLESDGTAEELYQQIQTEKQKLIKEGKIRKEKPLPEITADEVPFEIPQNWIIVRLQEIAYLTSGNQYEEMERGIPYVKVGDMNLDVNQYEITTSTRFTSIDNIGIIPVASIVFPKRGGAILTNKKRIVSKTPIFIDSNTMAMTMIVPDTLLFIKLWFDSINLGDLYTGTSIPQINNKDLNPLMLPLPPLAEQKRIVERVEEIFRLLDTIDQAQEKYSADAESLRSKLITAGIQGKLTQQLPSDGTAEELYQQIQAEKQKLISEGKLKKEKPLPPIKQEEIPFEIPKEWKWVRFSEVYDLSNGIASRGSEGGIERPVLRLADIRGNCLNIDNIRGIQLTDKEYNTHIIQKNDLVIIRVNGSKERVAMAFPYKYDTNISYCDHLFCARKKSDLVYSEYFATAINTKAIREQIVPMIKTTAGQNTISQGGLNGILLPLPPLAEQKRIAETLERVLVALE